MTKRLMRNRKATSTLDFAMLAIVAFWAFFPVLGYHFLNYDDTVYVTENPAIQDGVTLNAIAWAFTSFHASNWHPVTWLSHMLDVELFGLHAGGHHLTSLVLHLVNTILLFVLLRRITGARWPSLLAAALFACHPLHVESVAWIAERKDVLSAFFAFLTFLAYDTYVKRPGALRYAAVFLFFAAGLMAKPMLVTLPLVLLLLDYWPYARFELRVTGPDARKGARLVMEKAPLLMLAGISSVLTVLAQHRALASLERIPLPYRIANALTAYAAYILKALCPYPLATPYPFDARTLTAGRVSAALALLLLITVLVWLRRRQMRYLLVGWLWFLGMLVPVVGIVQVGSQALADRYTYLPLIGLFIMLAWTLNDALRRFPKTRIPIMMVTLAVLCACFTLTVFQVRHWRNSETLFRHALAVTRDNSIAHNNLGKVLIERGDLNEAAQHFQAACRIAPDNFGALNNLGAVYLVNGQYQAAARCFVTVLGATPNDAEVRVNLGVALYHLGKHGAAREQAHEALRLKPGSPKAYALLQFLDTSSLPMPAPVRSTIPNNIKNQQ